MYCLLGLHFQTNYGPQQGKTRRKLRESQLNVHQIFRREEEGKRQEFLKKFCPLFDKQVITSLLGQFWESFENTPEINR